MPILIEHKYHGRMHVYSMQELERHEKLGWKQVIVGTESRGDAKKRGRKPRNGPIELSGT